MIDDIIELIISPIGIIILIGICIICAVIIVMILWHQKGHNYNNLCKMKWATQIIDKIGNIIGFEQDLVMAKDEFKNNAGIFGGLYSILQDVVNNKSNISKEIFISYSTRISNLENASALQKYWGSLTKGIDKWDEQKYHTNAEKWLNFMIECGLHRGESGEMTVDDMIYQKYYSEGDIRIYEGEKVVIIKPCWEIDNKIVEKGIVRKISNIGV